MEPKPLINTDFISDLDSIDERKTRKNVKKMDRRLQDLNILLVEDVADNQALMGHFLGMAGAHVDIANNGLEGIEKALSGNHDIVLMDIQMPVLDGYEATRKLREMGFRSPIVALTAHALTEERERSFDIGFDDHLAKPVEFNSLIDHLLNVLPKDKVKDENYV